MSAMHDAIVITTGARLHFGFFAQRPLTGGKGAAIEAASNSGRLGRSNYGGIGLMIDSPSCVVAVSKSSHDRVVCHDLPASEDAATASLVARLVAQYRRAAPPDRQPRPCLVEVRRSIPPHCGLGSGTQLAMAIAQGLALLSGDGQADARSLALRVVRGKRSAIGIHGFARGGFLVDGGKLAEDDTGRLVARTDVPDHWRFLLIGPADAPGTGLSGLEEINALDQLPGMPLSLTDRLCRLALVELLPALREADCEWFGEGLFQFGQLVGDYFRPIQGGRYADARMAELVEWLRSEGVRGVAQTSWGPTIAVCCGSAQGADSLQAQISAGDRWQGCRFQVASPLNTGAAIEL